MYPDRSLIKCEEQLMEASSRRMFIDSLVSVDHILTLSRMVRVILTYIAIKVQSEVLLQVFIVYITCVWWHYRVSYNYIIGYTGDVTFISKYLTEDFDQHQDAEYERDCLH